MKLVTVIIPTYNYGTFIGEAIQSVLHQTYRNIELLVVDDGSTDNTAKIVSKYPMVTYHRIPKFCLRTPARAMNAGISLSHGDYIICFAADDLLDPRYIEKCVSELQKNNADFVWTGCLEFGRKSKVRMPRIKKTHRFSMFRNPDGQLGAMLVRREVYDNIGLYDENLHDLEDWDLAIRACLKGWTGIGIHEVLHYARQHKLNLSRTHNRIGEISSKHHLIIPYELLSRRLDDLKTLLKDPRTIILKLCDRLGLKLPELPSKTQHLWVDEKRILKQIRGTMILDCGCGLGRWGHLLGSKYRIVGIDIMKEYLLKAKSLRAYQDLILGDLFCLPFKRKSFDTALAVEVIEHLVRTHGIIFLTRLREIARKVVLTTPRHEENINFGINHPETHKSHWTRSPRSSPIGLIECRFVQTYETERLGTPINACIICTRLVASSIGPKKRESANDESSPTSS